jgi:hypothetical protein
MTEHAIRFEEIDQPGKLVCYVELSGLPIASMKALGDWYNSYRKAGIPGIPVHTHKCTSTFVHPRELSMDELAERAEGFKLFLEAVALGVLSRTEKGEDAGLYKLKVKGSARLVGDEKLLRLNGFDQAYRATIKQQVEFDLDDLKNADQLALWVALMEYYLGSVYTLALRNVDGVEQGVKGLPALVSERLVNEWTACLNNVAGSDSDAERLLHQARNVLSLWTEEIEGSTADVYAYEVNLRKIQPKRVLKREVLMAGWTFSGVSQSHSILPPPVPPPIVYEDLQFHLLVGSTQYGPYNLPTLASFVPSGQLTAQSMVWRNGMAAWSPAWLVPELATFLWSQPSPPPPLVAGVLPPSLE